MQLCLAAHYKQLKKNSCEKWCPKFKATSIRVHFSAWWIIEHQAEQPWVFALFCDGFCMNKTLFGLQSCLRCRDTAACSNTVSLRVTISPATLFAPVFCPCISNSASVPLPLFSFCLLPFLAFALCHFFIFLIYLFSLYVGTPTGWPAKLNI